MSRFRRLVEEADWLWWRVTRPITSIPRRVRLARRLRQRAANDPMRWFTFAWHVGAVSDEESDRAIADYRRHLAELASSAPAAVRELTRLNLHDGQVQHWSLEEGRFRWQLLIGDLQAGYRFADIEYDRASLVGRDEADLGRAGLDAAGMELISDELDTTGDGRYEHRFYFSDHSVFAVRFREVDTVVSPASGEMRR